jgi:transglutaminase-like putative cysteine protease
MQPRPMPSGNPVVDLAADASNPESVIDKRFTRRTVSGKLDQAGVNLARRRSGALIMAVVALSALLFKRSSYDSLPLMLAECSLGGVILFLTTWYGRRRSQSMSPAMTGLLLLMALSGPWLLDVLGRRMGHGNGMEILMLGSLAWAALLSATVAKSQRSISISVILSGFLTLFTSFIAEDSRAIGFTYLWGVLCLWWLVSNHWEQLQSHTASEVKAHGGYRLFVLALGCLTFFGITAVVSNRVPVIRKLTQELLPTSGGSTQKDSVGRGVGDGDALLAARNHPTSFGAVDTDMFLESTKPSLFDVIGDEAGAPKRNRRVERAQALRGEDLKVEGGRFSEANQSSSGNSDFSTARQRPKMRQPPQNIVKESLMFWAGQAGSRLAVERFTQFDGVDWTNPESVADRRSHRTPESVAVDEQTWFFSSSNSFPNPDSPFTDTVAEALKFTRFRSPIIPTRSGLQMWSIDLLDRADFFSIDKNDLILMPDRLHVPDYTVIRFINSRIDLQRLEQLAEVAPVAASNPMLSDPVKRRLAKLGDRWGGDRPRGLQQVIAIVDGFRRDFALERDWTAEETAEEKLPLEQFLDSGSGPAYLFATAASQVLQEMGYETRLVTGFYTNAQHFLQGQREIAVLPRDAHVWLEWHVGRGYWIPLEPTPGFQPERFRLGLWYWFRANRLAISGFFLGLLVAAGIAYLGRGLLLEGAARVGWLISANVSDRRRIAWLARLIDLRCRFAGNPRQKSQVLRQHLGQSTENWPEELSEHWRRFLSVADRACFGEYSQLGSADRLVVQRVWQGVTFFRIRNDRQQLKRNRERNSEE